MITFEEAQDAVRQYEAANPLYPADNFYVCDFGMEDASYFVVPAGTYSDTHDDGELSDLTMGGPLTVVEKATGHVRRLYGPEADAFQERDMEPYGDVPDTED